MACPAENWLVWENFQDAFVSFFLVKRVCQFLPLWLSGRDKTEKENLDLMGRHDQGNETKKYSRSFFLNVTKCKCTFLFYKDQRLHEKYCWKKSNQSDDLDQAILHSLALTMMMIIGMYPSWSSGAYILSHRNKRYLPGKKLPKNIKDGMANLLGTWTKIEEMTLKLWGICGTSLYPVG